MAAASPGGATDDPLCFYNVLGLSSTASQDEIRAAYRRLAISHHPDKNPGNEEASAHIFKLVAEAYEVLSDEEKRRVYDAFGHRGVAMHEQHQHQPSPTAPPPPAAAASSSYQYQYQQQQQQHGHGGVGGGFGGFGFGADPAFRHAQDIFAGFFSRFGGGDFGFDWDPFGPINGGGGRHRRRQRARAHGRVGGGDPYLFGADPFFDEEEEGGFLFGGGMGMTGGPFASMFQHQHQQQPPSLFSHQHQQQQQQTMTTTTASASSSSSSSSVSVNVSSSGGRRRGGTSRSVQRVTRRGTDGVVRTRTETTVSYPDGRRETSVVEEVVAAAAASEEQAGSYYHHQQQQQQYQQQQQRLGGW